MAIDPKIALMGQTPQFDNPMDVASKALTMKGMMQQQQAHEQDMKTKASELQKQQARELIWSITDENSYQGALAKSRELGLPGTDQMPQNYDERFVRRLQLASLPPDQQLGYMKHQEDLSARELDRKEAREERRFLAGVAQKERQEIKDDQYVEKLQGKIAPLQEIQNSISSVENLMGFKLDQYDEKKNKAVINGKSQDVDLPGVSIPGYGRVTIHSEAARRLDDTMAAVFNVELKDRSGAAVTTPELDRLKQEFSSGKFNTEAEKLAALKAYKTAAIKAMKNVEAGYAPRVVDKYQDRGGMTSRTIGGGKQILKTQTNQKTGERRVVYTDGTSEIISSGNTAGR